VLVDFLFYGAVLKLQLLRSFETITLFSLLFLSFILQKQIKRDNYFFLGIYLLFLIPNPFTLIYRLFDFWTIINILFLLTAIYEYLVYLNVIKIKFFNTFFHKIFFNKMKLLQKSIFLISFIIFIYLFNFVAALTDLDVKIKSIFIKINENNIKNEITQLDSLLIDITKYIDNNIFEENVYFLAPLTNGDFSYLTKHNIFVNRGTMYDYHPKKILLYKEVFNQELGYQADDLKQKNTWNKIWQNLNEKQINAWKIKYGITHIIREKDMPLNLKKIYSNLHYDIYLI
jgi:hypothetical protein